MTIIQSIKISAAISSVAVGATYTCPANSYAIINVHNGAGVVGLVSIGGAGIATLAATGGATDHTTLYVGPSQVVTVQNNGGTWTITGVEFTNS